MLCFTTPTTLDLRVLTTMGVNVKPNSASPIGHFGTGLKYAMAILLRTGHAVKIETGGKVYHLTTTTANIRGKEFSLCQLVGPDGPLDLPFTLDYGKEWELWMAYRELVSNTWDEGGSIFTHEPRCAQDETQITVSGPGMDEVHNQRNDYFLSTTTKRRLATVSGVEIYDSNSPHIFYKGIRAYTPLKPTLFTYNLTTDIALTEDRTIRSIWSVTDRITTAISNSQNEYISTSTILASVAYQESSWDFNLHSASSHFITLSTFLYRTGKIYNALLSRSIREHLDRTTPTSEREPTPREATLLQRALTFLSHSTMAITHPIAIASHLPNSLLGTIRRTPAPTIILSPAAFNHGLRSLCGTLVEEELHLRSGAGDETREMQEVFLSALLAEMEARQEVYL